MLLEGGFLHADCITCTGRTVRENLADVPLPAAAQKVRRGHDSATIIPRSLKQDLKLPCPPRGGADPRARRGRALSILDLVEDMAGLARLDLY